MYKTEKLTEAREKLKSDFVGLDEIIDKIIDSITPWYLTPEILERPTIISLWGLTGTGKTSLVKKLISYLDLSNKSLFFDCGEQGGETDMKLFSEKLDNLFGNSGKTSKEMNPKTILLCLMNFSISIPKSLKLEQRSLDRKEEQSGLSWILDM